MKNNQLPSVRWHHSSFLILLLGAVVLAALALSVIALFWRAEPFVQVSALASAVTGTSAAFHLLPTGEGVTGWTLFLAVTSLTLVLVAVVSYVVM